MIIKKVMFSGPKENNSPDELIKFVKSDEKNEIGLYYTCHSAKGNSRYDWAKEFAHKMKENNLNSTLQLGYEWCEDFCNGKVSDEISEMLRLENENGKKTFHGIQLNFFLNQHKIDKDALIEAIKKHSGHRFILSYNTPNKDFIDSLTFKGLPFDVLYKPFSEVEAIKNNKDFFNGRMQGYSDEFIPTNIGYQLDKISSMAYPNMLMYIDIYKAILDENDNFSFAIANSFVENINNWISSQQSKKRSV